MSPDALQLGSHLYEVRGGVTDVENSLTVAMYSLC